MEVSRAALTATFTAAVIGAVGVLLHFYNKLWKIPEEVRRKLREQGITGPPPSFLYGNSPEIQKIRAQAAKNSTSNRVSGILDHDYYSKLFPCLEIWRKQYGPLYTYSIGRQQYVHMNKAELVKELNMSSNLDLGKPFEKNLKPIFGNGIVGSNGVAWLHQKKIIAPHFFINKVKGMVGLMLDSAQPLLNKWENRIKEAEEDKTVDIQVDDDLKGFSADVISRACFGTSYVKGKHIFSKLRQLKRIINHRTFFFGHSSFRCCQSKQHREIQKLEKEIESLIWETVQERERECSKTWSIEKDLLQLIMEGAINDPSLGAGKESSKKFIVDNCKSIYFVGHDTSALTASWCLMLLALHPDWQARIRTEISHVCPHGYPDAASITQLNTVSMVIQETLRLYPPSPFMLREARADTQVGNITVPKGVCLRTFIPALHRDASIWGDDANEFKPERFENGIAKACKFPQAYIPFGTGHRMCFGKNFALVELKIIISLIVSKFQLSLSPRYHHSPSHKILLEPEDGVRIVIKSVKATK